MTLPIDRLEEVAIMQNADLREQYYNARIATEEGKEVIARLFPNLSFNYAWKYDNDSYLVNQNWREAGAAISFNLFNLLSAPAQMQMARAERSTGRSAARGHPDGGVGADARCTPAVRLRGATGSTVPTPCGWLTTASTGIPPTGRKQRRKAGWNPWPTTRPPF